MLQIHNSIVDFTAKLATPLWILRQSCARMGSMLAGIEHIERTSTFYGKSFELFILMELRAYLSYQRKLMTDLHFWRSRYGHEVDFLVGKELAIEVKASTNTSTRDLKGLKALSEEGVFKKFYLVSQDHMNRKHDAFHLVHWQTFLHELWSGQLL